MQILDAVNLTARAFVAADRRTGLAVIFVFEIGAWGGDGGISGGNMDARRSTMPATSCTAAKTPSNPAFISLRILLFTMSNSPRRMKPF